MMSHRLTNWSLLTPPNLSSASWQSLPEMWDFLAEECGDQTAIIDPTHPPNDVGNASETRLTYSEVRNNVRKMAEALVGLGVQRRVRKQDGICERLVFEEGMETRCGTVHFYDVICNRLCRFNLVFTSVCCIRPNINVPNKNSFSRKSK